MEENNLKWIWRHSQGERGRILLACLCGIVRVGLSLSFVWISKLLVDSATDSASTDRQIVILSALMVGLMLLEMAFSFASSYFCSQAEIRMKNRMRADIYNHLLGCRRDRLSRLHSGDLLNRITEDVRVITDAVCSCLPGAIVMLLQFAAAFFMLYSMSWQLAACVVCIMPFFLIISKIYVKKTRRLTSEIRSSDSLVQTTLQEGLQHHVVVQTLECEQQMKGRLGSLQQTLYGQSMHRLRFGIFSRSMMRSGFIACYATAFIWSVWHLRTGLMTYGMMTAFLQLVSRIQNPMVNIAQMIPTLVHALSSSDRLKELEQIESEAKGKPVQLAAPIGIKIDGITFRYEEGSPEVYSGFSYDFAPGSRTVLMGATGAGKSTLVKLLLALMHPQEGHITLYDPHRKVEASPATRCNMVYVPQGNSLLEGTIRSNLLLGDPEATEEMMRTALHTAAADFVHDLPGGLDTRCSELGGGLSEGQAQRIAIARALLRKGGIMLLDEFNSSLDEATARTLLERLLHDRPQNTIIFISHRKEVAAFCDNILNI